MIRRANIDDARTVAILAVKLWDSASEDELASEFEELLSNPDAAVFVACAGDAVIGFAQCQLRHDYVDGTESSPVGYLEGVFVDDLYRKGGYGKLLVSACEVWAKEQGCTEFASDCELDNDASLAFHLHCGFAETNRIICFAKRI